MVFFSKIISVFQKILLQKYVWKNKTKQNENKKQNKTKQNKTKQNKTKQNKTKQNKTKQNKTKQNKQTNKHTPTHTPTCPGIQSEDTIYTSVYTCSVFVQAFKARTNLCITHSKWGHFFTHLWTCLARTKRGLRPYPPTPILWKSEDSAHSHKARTEILTSLCQNVLFVKMSSLWM